MTSACRSGGLVLPPVADPGPVLESRLAAEAALFINYQGSLVTTDGEGFRNADSTRDTGNPAPSPDAPCVVGIGDSFMFGQGVPGRDTYMAVAADRLAAQHGRELRVVNAAVPGYNGVMEVAALEAKGLECGPAVVIIEFVGNDLSLPNFVREPKRAWSLRRSFLGDYVKERLGGPRDRSLHRRLLDAGLLGIPQDPAGMGSEIDPTLVPANYRGLVGWDPYAAAMKRLQDLSTRHGFEVVSICLGPGDWPLKTRALELSRDLGFHVLDIGAAFQEYLETNGYADYMESPLALSPDDGHPSILAHRIAGELLADHIEGEILPRR